MQASLKISVSLWIRGFLKCSAWLKNTVKSDSLIWDCVDISFVVLNVFMFSRQRNSRSVSWHHICIEDIEVKQFQAVRSPGVQHMKDMNPSKRHLKRSLRVTPGPYTVLYVLTDISNV